MVRISHLCLAETIYTLTLDTSDDEAKQGLPVGHYVMSKSWQQAHGLLLTTNRLAKEAWQQNPRYPVFGPFALAKLCKDAVILGVFLGFSWGFLGV